MLAIVFIVLCGGLVGYAVMPSLINIDPHFDIDSFEYPIFLVFSGLLFFGWILYILTELSLFSAQTILISLLIITLIGITASWFSDISILTGFWAKLKRLDWQKPLFWENGWPNYIEHLMIFVWLLALSFVYMRPHQAIIGAADVGVYINLAANINRTGGLPIFNEVLDQISQEAFPAFVRTMPEASGGYKFWSSGLLLPNSDGEVALPFYHLHPMWQAVGIAFGGYWGGLLLTPFWGLSSVLAIYTFIRRLFKKHSLSQWIAFTSLVAISITSLQVWFVRYGTAEALTQFLFWSGLWGFSRWTESDYKSTIWASFTGVAWGMTFLARIDTFFIWCIPALLLLTMVIKRKWHISFLLFLTPLTLLMVQSVWHALTFSEPYFYIVFESVLGDRINYLPYVFPIGIVILAVVWFLAEKIPLHRSLFTWSKLALTTIFIVFFLYNLWVRPTTEDFFVYSNAWDNVLVESWNHQNLFRLQWYLSAIGIWGAFLGIVYLITSLKEENWMLITLGLMFTFLYIWNIRSNGTHLYSQRRYIPIVLPFFIVSTGLFIDWFVSYFRGLNKFIITSLLCSIWLFGLAATSYSYSRQTDFWGTLDQIESFSAQFPDDSIILFNQRAEIGVGDFFMVPLFFLHEKNSFTLRHLDQISPSTFQQTLSNWNQDGYQIYWIDVGGDAHPWPFEKESLVYKQKFRLETPQLESVANRQPTEILNIVWQVEVYKVDLNQIN
ncbi:MAG: hypothetical protein AAF902_16680 [Chloroflexota bacterium]